MTVTFYENSAANRHEPARTTKKYQSTSSYCLCSSLLILPLLLFLSCQSAPKIFDAALLEISGVPLDGGASAYILADAKEARPIIELLPVEELDDSQTKQMLDMTHYLAAAIFPQESGRRFQLAAWGNYPSSRADMAFSVNKSWNRQRSAVGYSYWHSGTNKLSIALDARQAFVAASTNDMPVEPIAAAPGVKMPEGFAEFRRGALLSCWINEGGPVINRILNNSGLPINFSMQELFIAFFPAVEGRYEASIRMRFESPSQARSMASLFSMANNLIYSEYGGKSLLTSVFFANRPIQNGRDLDIKTAPLGEKEIAAILGLLL